MTDDAPQPPLPDLVNADRRDRSPLARLGLLLLALLLFVLAIVGWLVPIVTGVPFWIAGFLALGMASPRAGRWINRMEGRLPYRWRLLLRPKLRREFRSKSNGGN